MMLVLVAAGFADQKVDRQIADACALLHLGGRQLGLRLRGSARESRRRPDAADSSRIATAACCAFFFWRIVTRYDQRHQ